MAIRFYHEFVDRANYLNEIEISADSWGGGPSLITHSSGNPIVTRHAGEKAGRSIIQGREVQFEFFVFPEDMDRYDDIFISDYGDYKIRHWVAGELIFEGWLLPENLSREYFKDKYIINLSATDGLAKLKDVEFRDASDSIIEGKISLLEIIKYAIAKIGINLDFRIQLGTYESALMASTECALDKIGAETRRFVRGNKPIFCNQVIEACLKPFSCTLRQQDGYWQITNKQEGDSMQFVFNYASLAQVSRTATSKIVDLTGYKYERGELSKISPLKDFGIIFRNKDLGEDATGLDLTDWNNDWTITFDSFSVDDGVIELDSGVNYPGDYIEPDTDFNLPYVVPFNNTDFVTVTFDYYIKTVTPTRPNPIILISLKHPDGTYTDPVFIYPRLDGWEPIDTKLHPALKVMSAGNHNVRFTFDHTIDSSAGNYLFYIKNVNISVISSPSGNPDVDTELGIDEYYKQTTGRNLVLLEEESQFADGNRVTETGSLLHNNTTLTTSWNSYGNTEGIKILDIWARNELNNRYGFKDYLKLTVHDLDNSIDIDSILTINGKYYSIVSYYKNHKHCIIDADIEELLLTYQSYSPINSYSLASAEGDSIDSSSNGGSAIIALHNGLLGIQGGDLDERYHFSLLEHTELTAWLDNVILSDAGGMDMDGTLQVDTIVEHSLDNGIDIDLINISTAAITTAETNMTFQDGTTGPHTLSDLISGTPSAHAASHHSGGSDLVNHDSLTGFVAAEHYSHTAISMSTASTSGLNGGGTIAATRNLVLAVNRLTAVTTLQTTDYFPFYDDSGSGTRRISYTSLITQLNGSLDFGSSDVSVANQADNRIITATGTTDALNAEGNLTFDGSILGTRTVQLASGYYLNFIDANVQIWRNVSTLTFKDAITGTKTLAELAVGEVKVSGTPLDDQIAVWTNATTIEGALYFSISGSTMTTRYILPDADTSWNIGSLSSRYTRVYTNYVHFVDSATYIWRNAGGNMRFTDAVTGSKTLAELAAVGSHSHGNITNAGAIGSTANLPIITTTSGVLTTGSFGTGANTFCQGNDSRLSNARTPTAHASSHHTGGSDLINHDSLTGFVGNEHIDHSGLNVNTAANTGLSGGGTLTASLSLSLDLNNLPTITTLQTADLFPLYDVSNSSERNITYVNLTSELQSDLSFGNSDVSVANQADNRIITATVTTDSLNAEANFMFTGSALTLTGTFYQTAPGTISATFDSVSTSYSRIAVDGGAGCDTMISFMENGSTGASIGWDAGTDTLKIIKSYGILTSTELLAEFDPDGACSFYYNNSKKQETTATGIKISGGLLVDNSSSHTALNLEGNTADTNSGMAIATLSTVCSGSSTEGFGPSLYFYYSDTSVTDYLMGYISMLRDDAGDTDSTRLEIWTSRPTSNPVMGFMQDSGGGIYLPELPSSGETTTVRWDSGSSPVGQLTYPSSDARYKTGIIDWDIDALGILRNFEPKQFIWKDGPSRIRTGWIAQEGLDYIPDMFPLFSKTNRYGLAEFEILPYFHKSINQLSGMVDDNTTKIERLEGQIIELQTKIKQHEVQIKRLG